MKTERQKTFERGQARRQMTRRWIFRRHQPLYADLPENVTVDAVDEQAALHTLAAHVATGLTARWWGCADDFGVRTRLVLLESTGKSAAKHSVWRLEKKPAT